MRRYGVARSPVDGTAIARYTAENGSATKAVSMKFVLTYTARDGGSLAEREAADKRGLQLLSKFQPSIQFSEWVDRVDGQGGFAVFETDDAAPMMKDIAIWAAMFHFEVYPVLDVLDSTALQQEAVDFRDSIS